MNESLAEAALAPNVQPSSPLPLSTAQLQQTVVAALEAVKGKDITVINTEDNSPLFARMVIASGDSSRHVKALARRVGDEARLIGAEVWGSEGEAAGEWVLVDLGDVLVHVMQPAVRTYYNLEELWQDV